MKKISRKHRNIFNMLAVALFAILGVLTIIITKAAANSVAIEPENGIKTGQLSVISDTTQTASNSKYVKFGSDSTGNSVEPLTPGTSWQWQLQGNIDTTVLDSTSNPKKMYDIDLFDVPISTIANLKAKGIVVVCYFSAGSSENWREDFNQFPASVQGNPLDGWAGEKWLDIRQVNTLGPIMAARMDLAVTKGCDGVEPDNVDGYTNNTGFPLNGGHQIAYLKYLSDLAQTRNLSIGLKNNVDQIADLVNDFDWALNESCNKYNECGNYSLFIDQNKAVFGVEYSGSTSSFCPAMNNANYDWLLKNRSLGVERTACRNG